MKYKLILPVLLLAVAILNTACALRTTEVPAEPSPIVQSDPTEGQARLMIELQNVGVSVELGAPIEQPFFTVQGKILNVNGADVQIFEYASREALEIDASQVSADGGSVGTSMVSWMATPHFFNSGPMLVLYVGDDAEVLAALHSVLGEQFAGG